MLEARGLRKSFGAIEVTRDVSLKLTPGERRVILGPNGAGKTTLFNLLVGELRPSAGAIVLDGRDVTALPVHARARAGLARSYQKNNLFEPLTIAENLALAAAAGLGRTASLGRDLTRDPDVRAVVEEVAERLALTGHLGEEVRHAPYGLRRALEVGVALAQRPRVLLMDEPTSGVGPDMMGAFHRMIEALPRDLTLVIIEHDMDLAFDVADRITVLNFGQVVFEGTPGETRGNATVRDIYLGTWQAEGGADGRADA